MESIFIFRHKKTNKIFRDIEFIYFNRQNELIAFKPFGGNYRATKNNYELLIRKDCF